MQNLVERFLASATRFSQRLAVLVEAPGGAEEYTYADVQRLAAAAAAKLRAHGLKPGERCALLAENHARWCAGFLGILANGSVAVPLDVTLTPPQIATLLRDAGASAIFASGNHLATARNAAESCPQLRHVLPLDELSPADSAPLDVGPARPNDLAAIFYTSGTTSDPKGVELTHGNLLVEFDAVLQTIPVYPEDRILGILPLFHVLALLANFWLPLVAGASVVFLASISSAEILRVMRERRITAFVVVPQFFYLIHQRITDQVRAGGRLRQAIFRGLLALNGFTRSFGLNLGKLFFRPVHSAIGPQMRLWLTGGSRFDAAVGRDLHRMGLTLLQAYGLTECSGAATLTPEKDNRIGSVGKPLPGVEVKIRPAEIGNAEAEESPYPTGEIAIRGPIVMQGYWNRPEATAAILQDGWLLTGDLGYLDPQGNLYITGRKKDVIILSSGKNIYPEEIEAHYAQSPYIKEICILGRRDPGQPLAERLHAVVVPNFDLLRERKVVNAREILRYEIESLSIQLPSHKRILSYDIWPNELPRTTTRKLKRFQIEHLVATRAAEATAAAAPAPRQLTPEDRTWLQEPRVARALNFIARAARQKADLHPDDNLELDLGLDSMQRVELLVTLEHEFGVAVEDETANRIFTVRELVTAILAAPPAGLAPATAPARALRPQQPSAVPAWDAILAAAPEDDPAFVHILKPKPLFTAFAFLLMRLLYLAARLLLPLRVHGREQLPRQQAYILCPNHQSYLDVFLLVSALPYHSFRRLFFLGASEFFATRPRQFIARWVNVIPVDPDANLVRAMQAGAFGLRHGKVLVLFPEGERTIDGEVKNFKKGAAILSAHLRVPIVPVALEGIYDVWPRGRRPQRLAPVDIRIGQTLEPPAAPRAASSEEMERLYARLTAQLRETVVAMFDGLRRLRPAA